MKSKKEEGGGASLASRLPPKKGGSKGSSTISAAMRKGFETEHEGPAGSKPRSVSKDAAKKEVVDSNVLSESMSSSMDEEDISVVEKVKNSSKLHQPKQFLSQLQLL